MRIGLANAAVTVRYDDGSTTLRQLSPPGDLWSIDGRYRTEHDAFALPAQPPHQAMLGNACRVCVVPIELVAKAELSSVTLETLSLEVITALMAVTVEE